MARFTVIFDACVLYPAPVRDLLLQLACTGLFRARWSDAIHDEWIRNVLKNRPDINACTLDKTRQAMNRAVPDCLVTGYEPLIAGITLPDENDRHVLAAAIRGRADAIVTYNLADFPQDALALHGVEAQHPDEFISLLIDLAPEEVKQAAKEVLGRLKNPPLTEAEYLDRLQTLQLVETARFLQGKIT